jgi:hypothetical protein
MQLERPRRRFYQADLSRSQLLEAKEQAFKQLQSSIKGQRKQRWERRLEEINREITKRAWQNV